MLETLTAHLATFQFIWSALLLPIVGWLGYLARALIKQHRFNRKIFAVLSGLPREAKEDLLYFYTTNQHTLIGDPSSHSVSLLHQLGLITIGPGVGEFHVVSSYLSMKLEYWTRLNHWVSNDPVAAELLTKHIENDQT